MKKHLSLTSLLLGLLLLLAFSGPNAHAQSDQCPRIYREGETLRTDPAQSYQWYRNGELIPGATQQTLTPTGASANYAVQVAGKASTPFAYQLIQVTLIGQAFDEHLRPVANARITVGNQTTQTDTAGRFQFAGLENTPSILLRGEKAGHWASQRRIMPTGRQTHVQLMLRSQPFEHELSAQRGGTISRGPFFLTLQPNGVLDANNQPYSGMVKIALNGGRPDDPNFGWMMPGGDFMAQDALGRERILYSYGFLSAHLQTPDGQPLKLDPNIGAQLRFVMPHTMVASAPDSLPLWHFDEAASIWKEEGNARREGAAYIGTVRHFSSWNCDWAGPWCQLRGKTIDCKGRPVAGAPLRLGQQIINSDSAGLYSGRVPATLRFEIQSMNRDGKITVGPFEEGSENEVEDLTDGSSLFGLGVINNNNILTILSYGMNGEVLHSVNNGNTYQSNNNFTTQIDSTYLVLVKDSMDCPTKVNYIRLGHRADCQMLDSSELAGTPEFYSIDEALTSEIPVYNLWLSWVETTFPSSVFYIFPCLQKFSFDAIEPMILPESIENLTQLVSLNISCNQMSRLPESVGNLTQLQNLYIRSNELTNLPESIGNLTNLRELEIQSEQLNILPESIGDLSQLHSLLLNKNKFSVLPESIGMLSQLERLELEANQLTSLPESIGNLNQLQMLKLTSNQLSNLPDSFFILNELRILGLDLNQLSVLPDRLGELKKLNDLSIGGNQLISLPTTIGNLTELSILNLNNNLLSSLPESIGRLSNLSQFYIGGNQLITLPTTIGNLSQLQVFSLTKNKLTTLPESIGNLTNLQGLNLFDNQLTSLPESFGNLKNLEWLDLRENQLTNLPNSFANLINLKYLYLGKNPIPPAEIERIRRLLPNCEVWF